MALIILLGRRGVGTTLFAPLGFRIIAHCHYQGTCRLLKSDTQHKNKAATFITFHLKTDKGKRS